MINLKQYKVWYVTGSQNLYGSEILKEVAEHADEIVRFFDKNQNIPVQIVFKPVVKTSSEILQICKDANTSDLCIGLIFWMHTFSPGKMWIAGLIELQKPFLHLHTQFNRDIPWKNIDMDFMNLNQSAHGGREFGFIASRLDMSRKIVVGHWKNKEVIEKVGAWCRVASAVADSKKMKIARIGDNMRQVAVTEGNKVSAQIQFGYEVNGYGIGDVVKFVNQVTEKQIDILIQEYHEVYTLDNSILKHGGKHRSLRDAAQIEIGLRSFLEEGGFTAFTNSFENLKGMKQLPGIATQRLMADGYGFGAEGDWKTAALVRSMKIMAIGLTGGNSFMEDYTYHFEPGNMAVLGSHMLEICPSIAKEKPRVEVHPLSIGKKEDPVRLVFNSGHGRALNATIVDMGNRFRLLVNTVDAMEITNEMPQLPVARVLWKPLPELQTAAAAWIMAGGTHHTCFSQNLSAEQLQDLANIFEIEFLLIDNQTDLYRFEQELRWNNIYFNERI